MKIYNRCAVVVFLFISSIAQASSFEVQEFLAEYKAYYDADEVGKASLQLMQLEDNTYKMQYHSKVSKFFLSDKRYEESVFLIEDQQLVPQTYHYKRSGTGRNKDLEVKFDNDADRIWVNGVNTFDWQGELDNQLFRLDLSRKLAENNTTVTYNFINYRGEKRQYELEVLNRETISLPYGELNAIKVKINRESNSRITYAWFAPSLNWTLVRLQQFKDGSEQGDIQLMRFDKPTK